MQNVWGDDCNVASYSISCLNKTDNNVSEAESIALDILCCPDRVTDVITTTSTTNINKTATSSTALSPSKNNKIQMMIKIYQSTTSTKAYHGMWKTKKR